MATLETLSQISRLPLPSALGNHLPRLETPSPSAPHSSSQRPFSLAQDFSTDLLPSLDCVQRPFLMLRVPNTPTISSASSPHAPVLVSRSLQPPELCCALCDMWSPPQSGFHRPFSTRARGPPGLYCAPCSTRSPPWSRSCRPSPPGPAALLGCAVCRVVRGPLHRAGPTDLCRGPRPPELGSTFLGPRCPAGSLPSAPGPAPSEAARLGAPSVPGQGEAVLLPTWEQE